MTGPVAQKLSEKLNAAFSPTSLNLIDESHQHAGHAGARPEGETHFKLHIVSSEFAGKSRIEVHRMITSVLAEELAGRVHALSITAKAE